MTERRPDPDALLQRLEKEEERRSRAKLKVFLGYAPGVGKTYKMLEVARELSDQGADVVVGCVETHGRYDTASLLLGLEIVPRREVTYRGRQLEEFDLEAALARKPAVLLLDELAHTNAPGGRHNKRWQDMLDLLNAGINVHTTLNIQHVESLNDVVAQITFIRVRETVPDAILDRADELELVDLPPEELLVRLTEGKVYFPEQAARASEHFFRRGNLLALRELSLRRAAERVSVDVQAYREEHQIESVWPTNERLLVCVGPAPASARLVRAAARLAGTLRAPWVAGYVENVNQGPLPPADRERLEGHLRLAESLDAEVVRFSGDRVGPTLVEYARKHNVTRIVIGKPTHPRWRDWLHGSLLEEVVRGSGDIDVHVISGDTEAQSEPRQPRQAQPTNWLSYGWAAVLVGLVTVACVAAGPVAAGPEQVMLYLLAIVLVAVRGQRGPCVMAAFLSVAAYDFFFVPPYLTFAVGDLRHLFTFVMMFFVGLLISGLTLRIRRQEVDSRQREERTATLYVLSRDLGSALDEGQVALVTAQHAAELFDGGAAVLLPAADGGLQARAKGGPDLALGPAELSVARWSLEHGRPAGLGTDTLPGARVTCVPLMAGAQPLAVLALAPRQAQLAGAEQRHFVDAFVRQAALALERAQLAERAKAAALRARTEEMRSSLLSAVSHDLRTPLAAIVGAASTVRDAPPELAPEQRQELLETVCDEAERLGRLVANLLDMVRLDSGAVALKREWVPLEEMIGSALTRLDRWLSTHRVVTCVPEDLPLLAVDPVLLEQVLVNLLENAVKYTPPGTEVTVSASRVPEGVAIVVADRGPGLPPGDEVRVFEKFYRGPQTGKSGVGLGLAIAHAIARVHGGTLQAANREGGGAEFRLLLPLSPGGPEPEPAAAETPEVTQP